VSKSRKKAILPEIKTNIKQNVYFKERLYFQLEIYKWHYALNKDVVEVLKNTNFYKKWDILISKI